MKRKRKELGSKGKTWIKRKISEDMNKRKIREDMDKNKKREETGKNEKNGKKKKE